MWKKKAVFPNGPMRQTTKREEDPLAEERPVCCHSVPLAFSQIPPRWPSLYSLPGRFQGDPYSGPHEQPNAPKPEKKVDTARKL